LSVHQKFYNISKQTIFEEIEQEEIIQKTYFIKNLNGAKKKENYVPMIRKIIYNNPFSTVGEVDRKILSV